VTSTGDRGASAAVISHAAKKILCMHSIPQDRHGQPLGQRLFGAPAGKQKILCAHSIFSFASRASGAGNAVARIGGGHAIRSIGAVDAVHEEAL